LFLKTKKGNREYMKNVKRPTNYIQTPRQHSTTARIDEILERRMKDFMLSRRRNRWLKFGE